MPWEHSTYRVDGAKCALHSSCYIGYFPLDGNFSPFEFHCLQYIMFLATGPKQSSSVFVLKGMTGDLVTASNSRGSSGINDCG